MSESDKRFLDLETKVAYQEKMLADLNEVLLSRGKEVDALQKRVQQLEKQFLDGPSEDPVNEPPPHY